jgi:hypothetical protein
MEVDFPWTQSSSRSFKEKAHWSLLRRGLLQSLQDLIRITPQSSPSGPHVETDRVDVPQGNCLPQNEEHVRAIQSAPNIAGTQVNHAQILTPMSGICANFEIPHEVRIPSPPFARMPLPEHLALQCVVDYIPLAIEHSLCHQLAKTLKDVYGAADWKIVPGINSYSSLVWSTKFVSANIERLISCQTPFSKDALRGR